MTSQGGSSGTAKSKVDNMERKQLSYVTSDVVTIYVGPKRKKFSIHEALLCPRSTFFASALQPGGFKESIDKEIFLSEDCPWTFSTFAIWSYNGKLDPIKANDKVALASYLQLYILADKLGHAELTKEVLDKVKTWAQAATIPAECIACVYENSVPESEMRKEIVRCIQKDIVKDGFLDKEGTGKEELLEEIQQNGDFAADLLVGIAGEMRAKRLLPDPHGYEVKNVHLHVFGSFGTDGKGLIMVDHANKIIKFHLGEGTLSEAIFNCSIDKIRAIDQSISPLVKVCMRLAKPTQRIFLDFASYQRMLDFLEEIKTVGSIWSFDTSPARMDQMFRAATRAI